MSSPTVLNLQFIISKYFENNHTLKPYNLLLFCMLYRVRVVDSSLNRSFIVVHQIYTSNADCQILRLVIRRHKRDIFNLFLTENVAYNAIATSSSTLKYNYARNAVDEDSRTYASTNREQNPQLTIIMSNSYNIKNIFLDVYACKISIYLSIYHIYANLD